VIYNGILPESSVVFNKNKEKYFLCASRISEEKCIDSIIDAFSCVSDRLPEYSLWIAGGYATSEYYEKIKKQIDSVKCSNRIKLLGHRDDVVELMKNATALVVASRFEGLGRMTVEATFSGCLVIGRNSGGTKEVLELTKGGFLFNSDEHLADLMIHVASLSDENYLKIIDESQKVVVKYFSNEKCCKEILRKYSELKIN